MCVICIGYVMMLRPGTGTIGKHYVTRCNKLKSHCFVKIYSNTPLNQTTSGPDKMFGLEGIPL